MAERPRIKRKIFIRPERPPREDEEEKARQASVKRRKRQVPKRGDETKSE